MSSQRQFQESVSPAGFSCYIFDLQGRVLITRRSLGKETWPGVWSNSVCGHLDADEPLEAAVKRRSAFELGVVVDQVELLMEDFNYRADDADSTLEQGYRPVLRAMTYGTPSPEPAEVMEWQWVNAEAVLGSARAAPFVYSPWMVAQLQAILVRGLYLRWLGGKKNRRLGPLPHCW
ncbi:isopentenyl-diphosphate Delta-isomerase [Pseudomonas silvicola]|nr:isopentenyl-diphosphate Delta-isomerase [Pseudomonas silvicola]